MAMLLIPQPNIVVQILSNSSSYALFKGKKVEPAFTFSLFTETVYVIKQMDEKG